MKKKIYLAVFVQTLLFSTMAGSWHVLAEYTDSTGVYARTDKHWYRLGETVTTTITNLGNETLQFVPGTAFRILSFSTFEVVSESFYGFPEPMPFLPGMSVNFTWDQVDYETWEQVSPGLYFAWPPFIDVDDVLAAILGGESELLFEIVENVRVPEHFSTIQEAINAANPGDTIYVYNGTYYEHVVVNKTVSLIGEDKNTTVIDGNEIGIAIHITTSNACIRGFTIRNGWGSHMIECDGVYIDGSSGKTVMGNIISDNVITNCYEGIRTDYSSYNTVSGNTIKSSYNSGIYFNHSSHNIVTENTFFSTVENTMTLWYSDNNSVFHNNFADYYNYIGMAGASNTWDDGFPSGGNYWSDYTGVDVKSGTYQNLTGGDGIWDTPYVIDENNKDHYPLVRPYWYWSNPITGDLNKDMVVDIDDVMIPALAFGSYPGHPNWNPTADLTGDELVDIDDVMLVALRFGEHI